MSVSVCLYVFVRRRSYLRNYASDRNQIFLHITYFAARSFSGGVVIRYVLPVLKMTSYLLISQGCRTSPAQLKRSAHAALGLAIKCAVIRAQ